MAGNTYRPPLDRVRLERLAQHRQQMPLPLTAQEGIGQILEMLPACALGLIAPAGGEQMQMGVVRPVAPMRVEHRDLAPLECLTPNGAVEVIQTMRPAAHERTQ